MAVWPELSLCRISSLLCFRVSSRSISFNRTNSHDGAPFVILISHDPVSYLVPLVGLAILLFTLRHHVYNLDSGIQQLHITRLDGADQG